MTDLSKLLDHLEALCAAAQEARTGGGLDWADRNIAIHRFHDFLDPTAVRALLDCARALDDLDRNYDHRPDVQETITMALARLHAELGGRDE